MLPAALGQEDQGGDDHGDADTRPRADDGDGVASGLRSCRGLGGFLLRSVHRDSFRVGHADGLLGEPIDPGLVSASSGPGRPGTTRVAGAAGVGIGRQRGSPAPGGGHRDDQVVDARRQLVVYGGRCDHQARYRGGEQRRRRRPAASEPVSAAVSRASGSGGGPPGTSSSTCCWPTPPSRRPPGHPSRRPARPFGCRWPPRWGPGTGPSWLLGPARPAATSSTWWERLGCGRR